MSTYTPVQIRCTHCGHEFVIELLEGIHITRLPEVREQILNGRFQFFTCPSCGTEIHVENDTIYTDFTNKHYVAVQSSTWTDWRSAKAEQAKVFVENFDMGPSIAQELGEGFTHRLVPDIAALREKLLIWDAGFDDRVVEAVKGGRQRELGVAEWGELWRVSAVLDGGHFLFARLRALPGGGFELVDHETVAHEAYDRWAAGDEWQWEFSLLLDDWLVDLHVLATSTRPGIEPEGIPPGPKGRHWQFEAPPDTLRALADDLPPASDAPPTDVAQESNVHPPPPPPPPMPLDDDGPPPPLPPE